MSGRKIVKLIFGSPGSAV